MQKRKIMSESRIQQSGSSAKPKPKGVQVSSISGTGKVNVGVMPAAAPQTEAVSAPAPAANTAKKAKFDAAAFVAAAKAKIVPVVQKTIEARTKSRANRAARQAEAQKKAQQKEPFRPGLRVLMLAGGTLTVMIVLLLVMQFAGGEPDAPVAEAVTPAPVVIPSAQPEPVVAAVATPEPFAAQADTTSTAQSSSDVMVGNIIDALRQSANSAPAAETQASAPAEPALNSVSNLAKIVVTAMEQGQSEAYIQRLLDDAQSKGEIQVPAPLLRADGSVDTATILSLFAKN